MYLHCVALVVKRQVNVRKDCLRKQTNYSRSRAVLYREQRSNAQFVSAIMLGSVLTALQSHYCCRNHPSHSLYFNSVSQTLFQNLEGHGSFIGNMTLSTFTTQCCQDLRILDYQNQKHPKPKASLCLLASRVFVGQDGYYVSGDPSCCVIPYAGGLYPSP